MLLTPTSYPPSPLSFSRYLFPGRALQSILSEFSETIMAETQHFNKGDTVEVIGDDEDDGGGSIPAYFTATILNLPTKSRNRLYVEYQTLSPNANGLRRRREHVHASRVRPVPPLEPDRSFNLCEAVEAFHNNGWRRGKIVGLFLNSRYLVLFDGTEEQIVIERCNLRLHRDWNDGFWTPPFEEPRTSMELRMKHREVKLRIKFSGRSSEEKFSKGTIVEVRGIKEGNSDSWFTAVVVDSIGNDKLLVEYQTLGTDDETELLQESVATNYVRPCPPEIPQVGHFKQFQEVDAWYNDGWLVGYIFKVLDDYKYIVHLMGTDEEMTVEHSKLRAHQDWIDGKWVAASKRMLESKSREREMKFKIKYGRRTFESKFSNGTMVEVKSNEEGYQGSWYSAVVVGAIGKDKLLVEYQTLKTEDETELLKEKADASYVRPCPPIIRRVDRFKLFERVDAWYNDGWWVGLIARILDGLNYAVYFWNTNEEIQFGHFNLRPHQEWIGGKWIADFMKKSSELPLKPKPGKSKAQNDLITSGANYFPMGMKVEVKSDDEGHSGCWYPAVILGSKGTGKYLVEYKTLRSDNKNELLIEEADAPCMRPSPPVIHRVDPFEPFDEVDAWCNDAWWVGGICKILQGTKYAVYIRCTNEVLEIQHSDLRPHQDWTDGKWVFPCRGRKF